MGKKLGNALIVYGVLNFLASFLVAFVLGAAAVYFVLGALVWMIILIALGNWQRSKARAEESRDKQTALLKQMADKLAAPTTATTDIDVGEQNERTLN